MSERYQQVKKLFSDVLEAETLMEFSIKDYTNKVDYINTVYNNITNAEYADMKKDAIRFLGISQSKFDEFLIEIICSNLYCDLSVILQIIGNKAIRQEYLLANFGINGHENNTKAERVRRRLQPDRIDRMEELKEIKSSECVYFAPTVISAYKDILLVNRAGTNISDISTIFIDIFKALFCEADEQSKNVRLIKSYRLWKFTPDTLCEVANIYKQILQSENSYRYAELIFLEKLFGLLTLNEILSQGFNSKDIMLVTKSIGKINTLGYSSMTKFVMSKINCKNHHIFEDVLSQYVYPLCSECITTVLKDIITYLSARKTEDRASVVEKWLKVCRGNLWQISSEELLKNINSDRTLTLFRTLFDLPEDVQDKEKKNEALVLYLTSQSGSYFYSCEAFDKIKKEKTIITKSIVNDRNYESFSQAQYIIYPDFCNEDEPKKSHRIKY